MNLVRVDMIISKLFNLNLLPTQMSQNVIHEARVVLDECSFFTAVWSRFDRFGSIMSQVLYTSKCTISFLLFRSAKYHTNCAQPGNVQRTRAPEGNCGLLCQRKTIPFRSIIQSILLQFALINSPVLSTKCKKQSSFFSQS